MNLTIGTILVWGAKLLNCIKVEGALHTFNVIETIASPYSISSETLIITQPEVAKALAEGVFELSPSTAANLKSATDAAGGGSPAAIPANSVAPVVSGTTEVGETLTGTQGTWTGTPTPTYTRKWQVSDTGAEGWADIPEATAATLVLSEAELGKYVRHVVIAANIAGQVQEVSIATAAITEGD